MFEDESDIFKSLLKYGVKREDIPEDEEKRFLLLKGYQFQERKLGFTMMKKQLNIDIKGDD